ncbi:TrkH family potassium uptake protein [Aequorivita echinoideorum]|uniref:TrkH family potassium uptake protein n=1 Tax=Aequorivita echinoideorum TaxID=1549647 RepID=A0ABS5S5D3_9FLAO|nr:TrkH family potassium uptake protein [Aequorivita echinoideorum]MBT0607572.1 TrkH family potassium uptake protein [Aequorivita echinoideorum]
MNRTIVKQVASLQIILGFVMMVPAIVALIYSEWYSLYGFLISGVITACIGFLLYTSVRDTREPEYKHALIIAALGWLMIIIVGGLPYFVIAQMTPFSVMQQFVPDGFNYQSSLLYFKNPLHCIFESTSAFTTTGLTMSVHEPSVGKAVLFYRHFSQWIGGAGFIVMALAIFRQIPGQGSILLYGSEASGTKLKTTVIQTARSIWKVYLVVTAAMMLYIGVGTYFILPDYPLSENIFDAINHAMAGQSTGGFSTLDDSIAGYQSIKMDMLFLLPMLLGGLSIPFLYRFIFMKKFSEVWTDIQTRAIIVVSMVGGIILSLLLYNSEEVANPIREGVFQFLSALTTTGWQTSNINAWDDLSVLFIVVGAMVVGGSAGATVGGIKIIRALLLQKGLRWHISKIFLSKNTVKTIKFNKEILYSEEMNAELARAGIFTLIYLLFVFISTMLTLFYMSPDYTLADAIFESASAQGTVGLSTGITDPSMSPILETVYIVQMWAGRIEIIPVLVLLRALFYGTKPRII